MMNNAESIIIREMGQKEERECVGGLERKDENKLLPHMYCTPTNCVRIMTRSLY